MNLENFSNHALAGQFSALHRQDRRVSALAALGAFYVRQGYAEKAVPLLRMAKYLLHKIQLPSQSAGIKPSLHENSAADLLQLINRHLAYALLCEKQPIEAMELLEQQKPVRAEDVTAQQHLIKWANYQLQYSNQQKY